MPSDKTLDVRPGSLDSTSMRYHELWLQRWLYSRFFVREGYPIPVVFSTPMDAFSLFSKLWSGEQNPFAYLLEAKDETGAPLYEPYPSPVRYPLISVMRKGIKFRPYQNFSIHSWKHINWPTISDTGPEVPGKPEQIGFDLKKCDLAHVTTSRMPMAFDYRFQVDHFCLRPDTQAFYVERLLNQFWRSGGALQTWIDIEYPGWGSQYVRLYVEGEVDTAVPEEYQDKNVEFRTSYSLVLEGFSIDVNYAIKPAVWKLIPWSGTPQQLTNMLEVALAIDLRPKGYNMTLEARPDIPSAGTCQKDIVYAEYAANGTSWVEDYGIPSSLVLGYGTFYGTIPVPVYGTVLDTGAVQTTSFYEGSYASVGSSGTLYGGTFADSGTQRSSFLEGSMDLWVTADMPGAQRTVFNQGTYALVILPGGSYAETGTQLASFYGGTYLDATVWGTGSDLGSQLSAFHDGTYLQVVIDGGTLGDSGTNVSQFYSGTYFLAVPVVSSQEVVGQASSFYSGTYSGTV